jgi:hypothetical protein
VTVSHSDPAFAAFVVEPRETCPGRFEPGVVVGAVVGVKLEHHLEVHLRQRATMTLKCERWSIGDERYSGHSHFLNPA